MAFVGAAIIAPGFEPIAKTAQAVVLRQPKAAARGVISMVVGYVLLSAVAFLTMLLLSRLDGHAHATLLKQPVLRTLTEVHTTALLMSGAAAVAGIIMIVSLRDLYVVGPLIVLVLISNVSLTGAALALGEGRLALAALERAAIDAAAILVLGGGVFYWKQRGFHKRRPLA